MMSGEEVRVATCPRDLGERLEVVLGRQKLAFIDVDLRGVKGRRERED